jgi:hypothetical protein
MAVTIRINGLSLVHQGSDGVATATLPDVCKTPAPPAPPVPTPYVNIARSSSLTNGTTRVLVDGGNPAAVAGSQFSLSSGDEAGVAGGVASSTVMMEATWLTFSFNVRFEGRGVCRLTDKMLMNHGNTACLSGVVQAPVMGAGAVAGRVLPLPSRRTAVNRFHLTPKDCLGGEKIAVKCDELAHPAQTVGQRCSVEVRLGASVLAQLTAKIGRSGIAYILHDVKRVGAAPKLPDVQSRPIPDLRQRPSDHNYTRNPRWLPPHFFLQFDDGSEHLVMIPTGQVGTAANPYCYQIELHVDAGGQPLFSSAGSPSSVDCANLLAHDCAEWAECMRTDHGERLKRFRYGTHFGAKTAHEPPDKRRQMGLESIACIGYLLAATSRGHHEFGLPSIWNEARKIYLTGSASAHIIPRSGVGLVKGLVEKARWTALLWVAVTEKMKKGSLSGTPSVRQSYRKQIVEARSLEVRVRRHPVCFGIPIAEVISDTDPAWAAHRAAIMKLTYGLTCMHGGYHTGLIARGVLYDADEYANEQETVFGTRPSVINQPSQHVAAWPSQMLIAVPPGLWQRLQTSR